MTKAKDVIDWGAIEAARKSLVKSYAPPPGWFTARDYSEKMGIGMTAAAHNLKKLFDAGKVERMRCWTAYAYRLKA